MKKQFWKLFDFLYKEKNLKTMIHMLTLIRCCKQKSIELERGKVDI